MRTGGGFVDLRFHSFLDRPAVKRRMDRRKRGILSRAGSFIRTAARSSLKWAPQKSLGEMTPEERERYERRKEEARRKGRKPPRRPDRASRPGEPPRLHMRPSPLKRLIYFAYAPARDSVVIGPLRFGSAGAGALEHGGTVRARSARRRVRIQPRPFMRPALGKGLKDLKAKGRTSLPRFWDNIVRS